MTFTQLVHKYTGSRQFLIGFLLFSIGSLAGLILGIAPLMSEAAAISNPFEMIAFIIGVFVAYIIMTGLLSLQITGFSLLYSAAKRPRLPERSLTALTLFQVYAIILVTLIGIAMIILLILGMVTVAAAALYVNIYQFAIIAVIAFVVFILLILFTVFYFTSLLRMINGLKQGILNNSFAPIRGVTMFTVLSFILMGIWLIALIANAVHSDFSVNFWITAGGTQTVIQPTAVTTLITYTGNILWIIVLNKFASELKKGRTEVFEHDDSRGYSNAEQAARFSVPVSGIGYERDNDGLGERRPNERVSDGFGDEGRND